MSGPNAYFEGGPADGELIRLDPDATDAATLTRGPDRTVYRRTARTVRSAQGICTVWEYHGQWRSYDER